MDCAAKRLKHEFEFKNTYDCVRYNNVDETDYYRKGNPYKIFIWPDTSSVKIDFVLS
jgi:hypothetical protein